MYTHTLLSINSLFTPYSMNGVLLSAYVAPSTIKSHQPPVWLAWCWLRRTSHQAEKSRTNNF